MSTRTNPFEAEPIKAAAYEQGYIAGFQDPAGDAVDFRPLAPDLLELYVQGADAGREDAHQPPAGDVDRRWATRAELEEHAENVAETEEHIGSFIVFKALEMISRKAIFGLVDLVLMVVGIQGNTIPEQFTPLDDDFKRTVDDEESDGVFYVPACSRTDHGMVTADVTAQGTWQGRPTTQMAEAVQALLQHGHHESYLARCDVGAKTCSPVWFAR